ncbi:MAG: DUF1684 domain-containing protein [Bacteroidota bacterium]
MRILYFFLVIVLFTGCRQGKKPLLGETEYQRKVNADFKDVTKSPLKKRDLKDFDGLDFFKFDSSFVIRATLKRTPNSEWFKMQMSDGSISKERVYGILNFNLNGQDFSLNVYQGQELMNQSGWEDYLFLPFLDETNGETTYGGGRYIDLQIPEKDTLIIDLNTAYNPYCAYNEKYACPIVPRENYLNIMVTAGLKDFKSKYLE